MCDNAYCGLTMCVEVIIILLKSKLLHNFIYNNKINQEQPKEVMILVSSVSYVVFLLKDEEYGIEISYAQEILRIPNQVTKIPNMPSYIEGVIDLRGKVIPIVDLKKRFGFEQSSQSVDSRLLIIDFNNTTIGLIVDDVSEIITINEESIEKLNSIISRIGMNALKGIGRIENRLILLIDILKLNIEVFESDKLEEKI